MTFTAAQVFKPLVSGMKMVQEHHTIVFDSDASHVLQFFDLSDFQQSKDHLAREMRTFVARQMYNIIPEEFLNFVITLVSSFKANAWNDPWELVDLLQRNGFGVLFEATDVLVVADADDTSTSLVVKYKTNTNEEHVSYIDAGVAKMSDLKSERYVVKV